MRGSVVVLTGILSTALFSVSGHAGMPGTMHDEGLLPNTQYKLGILEFTNPSGTWGLEISQILTRELLGSLRGVSDVAVLNLRQDEQRVEIDAVTATEIAKKNQALAVVWGEFFENGDKVYLHSHLRVVPDQAIPSSRKVIETHQSSFLRFPTVVERKTLTRLAPISLVLRKEEGVIKANPPSLVVNFAPIEFDTSSLQAIKASHQQTSTMRSDPSTDAPQVGTIRTEDGFIVQGVRAQWMQIRTLRGTSGWVNYASLESSTNLSQLQSLLIFAEGVLQYMSGNFKAAEETISTYLDRLSEGQDNANLALAHILLGNSHFQRDSVESAHSAADEYLRAAELLPNVAAPVNYLAVARLREFRNASEDVPEMHDLEARLIRAVQAQNDSETLNTLRVLYKCAGKSNFLRPREMSTARYASRIAGQIDLVEQVATELKP